MKQNVIRIAVSSIPSNKIILKIKHGQNKAFNSSNNRFDICPKKYQNILYKQYSNLIPSTSQSRTTNQSQQMVNKNIQPKQKMHFIIPKHLNNLLTNFEKIKNQQQNKINNSLNPKKQRIKTKALSTYKKKKEFSNFEVQFEVKKFKIKDKPSASFMVQPRQIINIRQNKNRVPGPGYYQLNPIPQQKQIIIKQQKKSISLIKRAMQILKEFSQSKNLYKNDEKQEENKKLRQWPQFIKNDHDRFGKCIFPIVVRQNQPGPGNYEQPRSIQSQQNKLAAIQQQRKLLKVWFHNN